LILLDGKVTISNYNGRLSFFGGTPISKKTATALTSSATLDDVISKINGILGILGQDNYNLISVLGL
jgi:hypothetical protein